MGRGNQVPETRPGKAAAILFLTGIFFINFIARVVFGPLAPAVEHDLAITHTQSGTMFLMISFGYFTTMTASGIISAYLEHRRIIVLSAITLGLSLLLVSVSRSFVMVCWSLVGVGLAAGLYLPSGIATVTSLVNPRNWGKALAIHEMAPNGGLVMAPVVAEIFLITMSWRMGLAVLGICSLVGGAAFLLFGRGGHFKGQMPRPSVVRELIGQRNFWVMMVLFSLGVSGSMGVYNMGSLYMVNEGGLSRSTANHVLALSRIAGVFMAFASGWAADRLGPKRTLAFVLLTSGATTVLLGQTHGTTLVVMIFLQAALSAAYFPPGLTALSRIGRPDQRNLVVSLAIPFAYFIGGGVIPTFLGYMGESFTFAAGMTMAGVFILSGPILVRLIRFPEEPVEREPQPAT